ncbi:hypothetical protein [Photobacterium sp. 53610]|uniref:hypothetical protein n=1 Tax=Photobacterium sp. 53610 TaxID=3102789 RepID=UPI002EDB9440
MAFFLNSTILISMAGVLFWLFRPGLRGSDTWRATLTPLASIIGSGFLVVAPLLSYAVGDWSIVAMLGIVLLAYGIGWVIRFNIRSLSTAEPKTSFQIQWLEHASKLALSLAYLISIAFYIRLLASFVMHAFGLETQGYLADGLATLCLLGIGLTGLIHGLRGMEFAEEIAVSVKLSIIAGLLIGLAGYQWQQPAAIFTLPSGAIEAPIHTLRILAGMLLVVQGFETSRYLGSAYSPEHRIQTMKHAQWLSGAIYVVFVWLSHPLLPDGGRPPSETAIITMSQHVSLILPVLLTIAAVMSQFSAAVADTAGFGGLFREALRRPRGEQAGYVIAISIAIALIWSINLFAIIALASRAFALYYLSQCLTAWQLAGQIRHTTRRRLLRTAFTGLGFILALVVIFAVPAESV